MGEQMVRNMEPQMEDKGTFRDDINRCEKLVARLEITSSDIIMLMEENSSNTCGDELEPQKQAELCIRSRIGLLSSGLEVIIKRLDGLRSSL